MAINPDIIKTAQDFISILESRNMHIEKAYIFGSHSRGTAGKYSDIDLALISNSFSGIRFDDNFMIIKNTPPTFPDIETHPFALEDFTESNPFAKEIMQTGFRLF